jgi:hypothetical protein
MCEPLTASAFILATLIYEGQYSLGVIPPVYNAGTWKSIAVNVSAGADWAQWTNVPYFVGPQTSPGATVAYRIKRVYVTNDSANLYLRVDNVSGMFPHYQDQPAFALRVYSQDFFNANAPGSGIGVSGATLRRPMSYMLERNSGSSVYEHWSIAGEGWTNDRTVDWVIAPQWDAATGRIEAVIPISSVSSGAVSLGDGWADVLVILASYDTGSSKWVEGDSLLLHYRLSRGDQNWIYGNIEE